MVIALRSRATRTGTHSLGDGPSLWAFVPRFRTGRSRCRSIFRDLRMNVSSDSTIPRRRVGFSFAGPAKKRCLQRKAVLRFTPIRSAALRTDRPSSIVSRNSPHFSRFRSRDRGVLVSGVNWRRQAVHRYRWSPLTQPHLPTCSWWQWGQRGDAEKSGRSVRGQGSLFVPGSGDPPPEYGVAGVSDLEWSGGVP